VPRRESVILQITRILRRTIERGITFICPVNEGVREYCAASTAVMD
jgi:hypothetical protein